MEVLSLQYIYILVSYLMNKILACALIVYFIFFYKVLLNKVLRKIQIKSFYVHNICVCTVYIYYVYIYIYIYIYIYKQRVS